MQEQSAAEITAFFRVLIVVLALVITWRYLA